MNFEKLTDSLWKLQIIGWSIYFVLMFVTFLSRETDESIPYILVIKGYRTLVGIALTTLLWLLYRRLIDRQSFGKNIAVIVGSSLVLGIVWMILEVLFFWATLPVYDISSSLQYKPRVSLTYALTIMAWSAIYFGVVYWKQLKAEQESALEARLLAETAQLEMLRYQVNPHFLFNAMNSIRASIDEDKNRAKQMVTQLSEFLRHSLLSGEKEEIPLEEELEAVRNYLAIEKIRFEEDLEVEFEIEPDTNEIKVPCFLLNPLVENAIKHGFQTSPKPLRIIIRANVDDRETLRLEVSNSGSLAKNTDVTSTKIGLNNVRERLEKLFPDASSFSLSEEDGFVSARIEIRK